jgi:hypothetical protein
MSEVTAIGHVHGHQKEGNLDARENQKADEAAKEAALQVEVPNFNLIPILAPPPTSPKFSAEEENQLIKLEAMKDRRKNGNCQIKEMITKPIMREIMTSSIGESLGTITMCDVLRTYDV